MDIGSFLDFICTKKDSRGYYVENNISYEQLSEQINELLPDDWNDPKYNYIYELASKEFGRHLN